MEKSATIALKEYYEDKLKRNGVNFSGIAWPDIESTVMRYKIMCDLFRHRDDTNTSISLLYIGCGPGFFSEYLKFHQGLTVDYRGIDISPAMIDAAQALYPDEVFEIRDILEDPIDGESVDYAVLNGVLTVKSNISTDDMTALAKNLVAKAFSCVSKGLAVNFMSEHVDWKRDDLFHFPFDEAMAFFKQSVTQNVVFRLDYGLWEYTAYLYRNPVECAPDSISQAMTSRLKGGSER